MEKKLLRSVALLLFTALHTQTPTLCAQGAEFTYQGRLNDGASPSNGNYDLRFSLHDAGANGTLLGALTNTATAVSNGLFTVALDFGDQFPGADRWLEIAVRTNGGGAFAPLAPRQKITATPYALHAGYAGDIEPGANVSFSGGSVSFHSSTPFTLGPSATNTVMNLSAQYLAGMDAGRFWWLGGNTGQLPGSYVLGTLDNNPLEFKVNGARALRLEPHATSPNVIGGSSANVVNAGFYGAVIGGGGNATLPNRVGGNYSTVIGGVGNQATGNYATAMGGNATASGVLSTAMGYNTIASKYASTAMGSVTSATGDYSTAMGVNSIASGFCATAMGTITAAQGWYSTAMGFRAKANHDGGFVWADSTDADFASTTNNQFLIRASGGMGINTNNPNGAALAVNGRLAVNGGIESPGLRIEDVIEPLYGTTTVNSRGGYAGNIISNGVVGGFIGGGGAASGPNRVGGGYATVLGGLANAAWGEYSTAMGYGTKASGLASTAMGHVTTASGNDSTAMGYGSTASGIASTAMGSSTASGFGATAMGNGAVASGDNSFAWGFFSEASGQHSMAAGTRAWATTPGSFVWADLSSETFFASTASNQFLIRAGGGVGINNSNPNGAALAVNGNVTVEGIIYANGFSAASATTPEVITPKVSTAGNVPLEIYVNGQRALRLEPTPSAGTVNVIGGSAQNVIGAGSEGSTIAGGGTGLYPNTVAASYAAIGGGTLNVVAGGWSTIAGGRDNNVTGSQSTVSGGKQNMIQTGADYSTIGGGIYNTVQTYVQGGSIAGGSGNTMQPYAHFSTIGGGMNNYIQDRSTNATIAGGNLNVIGTNSSSSLIGGGEGNSISDNSHSSSIGGGYLNTIQGFVNAATIGGGYLNKIQYNSETATIGGGNQNIIQTNAEFSTIGGGFLNQILAYGTCGTIGGGNHNFMGVNSRNSTVAGGSGNTVLENAQFASISGGSGNRIQTNGNFATIPGGYFNSATNLAFAAGNRAKANHTGAFVWADSTSADFASTANDQFLIRASGGLGINKNNPAATLDVNGTARINGNNNWGVTGGEGDFRVGNDSYRFKIGVANGGGGAGDIWMRAHGGIERVNLKAPGGIRMLSNEAESAGVSLAAGGTAWAVISDRNAKKDFSAVDSLQILEKLAAMPITQWHYKWESGTNTPHIGPMAQDFKAAFYPGSDDKHITTQEADGVALAAIQGLNQKVEEQKAENAELQRQLNELKALVKQLAEKK